MDAEGLGRKLLLTPSNPRRAPEKQTAGTVTASHKMLTLQALSSSVNAGNVKRGCLGRGEAFGCPPAVCPPKRPRPFARYRYKDAAFLLTIGSFLLTVELFYLQLTILAFLLTLGAFSLTVLAFLLTIGAFSLTVGKCV